MSGSRIVAIITAAGLIATGLSGQDRGRQQMSTERQVPTERQMAPSGFGTPVDRGSDQRGFFSSNIFFSSMAYSAPDTPS